MTVSVVYEDQVCRDNAIEMCDRVLSHHWEDIDVECNWWKFMYLWHPHICQEAADFTARADLVIFSVHGETELSLVVRKWIQSWVSKRTGRPGALISLVGVNPERRHGVSPVGNQLRELATQAGMDFFLHEFDTGKDSPAFYGQDMASRAEVITPLLEEILKHRETASRWGINE